MQFGLDEEIREEENTQNETESTEMKRKRQPFAYWTVGGETYRLKLTTAVICQLENQFKKNLMEVISSGTIPPLAVMLTITQGAMRPWHHKMKFLDVQKLFDRYCEEGGTQLTFMTDVLMPIYSVSGFFSESQQETMDAKMEDLKDSL